MDIRLHSSQIQSGVPTPHKRDGRQVNGFARAVGLNSPLFLEGYTLEIITYSPPQSNLLLIGAPTYTPQV